MGPQVFGSFAANPLVARSMAKELAERLRQTAENFISPKDDQ